MYNMYHMVTEENIYSGKVSVSILAVLLLVFSAVTSWTIFYVSCSIMIVILFMLTVDNIRDKHARPLSRSFGQIGRLFGGGSDRTSKAANMESEDDIKVAKICTLFLTAVCLAAAPFTSWFNCLVIIGFIYFIILILTCFNMLYKRKRPLDRAFVQFMFLIYAIGVF